MKGGLTMNDDASPFSLGRLLSCTRRGYLFRVLGGMAAIGGRWLGGEARANAATPATKEPTSGLIADENRKPGATDWQLTRVRVDASQYRSPWVEGYCSKQSVRAGESIDIMVSTDPALPFRSKSSAWAITVDAAPG